LTSAIRSLSLRSLKPILTPGALTTALVALWPTTKPETYNPSKAASVTIHRANADFWNDYLALPATSPGNRVFGALQKSGAKSCCIAEGKI
jgi:hypothetical protein